MPDKTEERITLDHTTLKNLEPDTLARLRSEFGASVELKSTKPGLIALLDNLTKAGGAVVASDNAYDRGFDRTNPGYDRYYDRAGAARTLNEEVINPAIDAGLLNNLVKR
jgi:hypothetical protein